MENLGYVKIRTPGMAERICIDLDGVIVNYAECKEGCDYSKYLVQRGAIAPALKRDRCPVFDGAKGAMEEIRKKGLYIIIHTGRTESERKATEGWLKANGIPYDELVMEKPRAALYVDDYAYHFKGWDDLLKKLNGSVNE